MSQVEEAGEKHEDQPHSDNSVSKLFLESCVADCEYLAANRNYLK